MKISINSDLFENLKLDFDTMINRTIASMMEKAVTESNITIKANIEIVPIIDTDPKTGEEKMINRIMLEHKVSSCFQVKGSCEGSVEEEYELIQDEESGRFVLEHKVSSCFQVKGSCEGSVEEEYELIQDEESGRFVVRKIVDRQGTLL